MSLLAWLLLLQAGVPLLLLAWWCLAPAASRVGLILQFAAIVLTLGWLRTAGVWLLPPWWMPQAMLGLVALRAVFLRPRWRDARWRPATRGGRALLIVSAALAGYAGGETLLARRDHAPPSTPVALRFPLEAGRYLVLNGGAGTRINAHLHGQDGSEPRLIAWRGNRYGVDLIAIDGFGLRADGLRPQDNRAYRSFGRKVLAPCDGRIQRAVDDLPDMIPPTYDRAHMAGNHLILACADGIEVVLAHLRRGSVGVAEGDAVVAGQAVAELGNSGGSDEAHLHIHAQRPGPAHAPMGGDPVPLTFLGRFPVRGDRFDVDADGRAH
jgi:hypothetical protein